MYNKEHKRSYTRAAMSFGALIGVVAVLIEAVIVKLLARPNEGTVLGWVFIIVGLAAFLTVYYVGIHSASKWMIKKDDKLKS